MPQNKLGEAEGYYQGDDAFFAQDPYMAAVARQPGYNPSSNVMPPAMQQMTSMLFGAASQRRQPSRNPSLILADSPKGSRPMTRQRSMAKQASFGGQQPGASAALQQAISSGQAAAVANNQRAVGFVRSNSKLRARPRGVRMNSAMFDQEAVIMSDAGEQKVDDDYLYQDTNFGDPAGGAPNADFNYDEMLNQTPRHVAMAADDAIKAGFFMNGVDGGMGSYMVGGGLGDRSTRQSNLARTLMHKSSMLSNTNSIVPNVPNFGRGGL